MIRSIKTRLLAGLLSGMAAMLILFAVVVYAVIRDALLDQFDGSLVSAARLLAAAVEREDESIRLANAIREIPEFEGKGTPAYYEMWDADGQVLAKSPSLRQDHLPLLKGPIGRPVLSSLEFRPAQPVRAATLTFRPELWERRDGRERREERGNPLTVVVARDSSRLLRDLRFLRWLLLAATVGTIAVSHLVGTWIVRRGLMPLNRIAGDIAAIREYRLEARIATPQIPTEMVPIQTRLNDLLARLEASFKRERRFTADVAHELRTPLAGIRSTLEVALSRPRTESDYQEAGRDCLDITYQMEALVSTLLRLARLEAGQVQFHREPLGLADLVEACWRPLADRTESRRLGFENALEADLTCRSDRQGLSLVFCNLLDNAAEYADQGGWIKVTGSRVNDSVEVRIANSGCTLSADQVAQVFDPFWRADTSRTDLGGHFGLGLALVERTVSAMGGRAMAQVEPGGVFVVTVVLPAG